MLLKSKHFSRYRDVALFLMKYGQKDLLQIPGLGLEQILHEHDGFFKRHVDATTGKSKELELAEDLEKLGPTFVKLGRLLATRPDFLPLSYLEDLSHLGENALPLSEQEVRAAVSVELNLPFESVFARFNPKPLSVSVIEQTHEAVLADGMHVVVKVQRPGVVSLITDDLEALDELATFYDQHIRSEDKFDVKSILEEGRRIILSELDYRQEAHNLRTLKDHLKELDKVIVRVPVDKYSTSAVLTIVHIDGSRINDVTRSGLLRSERARLAQQLFSAYLQQFLIDGFVDADPDPVNLLVTTDGKVALLDVGIVARIAPAVQEQLIQLLLSICEGRSENTAEYLIKLSHRIQNVDEEDFEKAVEEIVLLHRDMSGDQMLAIGKVFQSIGQASVKYGVSLPSEFAMLGTALLKLETAAHILDPQFNSNSFIYQKASGIMKQHIANALSASHVLHTVRETLDFAEKLPSKVNRILDLIASNRFAVTVHAVDEKVLISGFQKIANRITVGLVLCALIIGASLLMRVQTAFTIFGYPGLAIICFMAAAGFGFVLVVEILVTDKHG